VKSLWLASLVLSSLLTTGGIVATAHCLAPAAVVHAVTPIANVAQNSDPTPSLSGNWQMSWTGMNGAQRQSTMQLKQDGTKLSGKLSGERGATSVTGSIQGNQVSFSVKLRRRQVSFTGTLAGDKMSGTTEQGAQWTATRQQ
jgi:hypothetical protein